MLFSKKPTRKMTMLEYGSVTGLVIGPSEISSDGKTYQLFENPIHLKDTAPKPLDVSEFTGNVIKVAGSVGTDTVYEAKVVQM
jgi:hypothetical protein